MTLILPIIMALAVLLAWLRLALWHRRGPAPLPRLAALVALQPVIAGLLYLSLVPPRLPATTGTLVVATAGAPAPATGDRVVALPEAPAVADAERVPDLATALRRHPGTARLRIIGHGLTPRDRTATAGLPLTFTPAAQPPGLVALALPPATAPGAPFRIAGNVAGAPGGKVSLRDPAGRTIATATLPPSGDFSLAATARTPGPADFSLDIRNAANARLETAAIPVVTAAAPPPRLLVIAGAAGPDLKYLRRWATDAGIALTTSIAAGAGLDVGDGAPRLDATSLARLDLLVLDERSWSTLSPGQRNVILAATRSGLGVLLRVTGPLPAAVRQQWAALGLPLTDTLATGPDSLTRLAPARAPATTIPLRTASGTATGHWRALGRGRLGVWPVIDSYTLVLAGNPAAHAALWSETLATLARPAATAAPQIPADARPNQRLTLCNLPTTATVTTPDGTQVPLLLDATRCAAFWPTTPGWHRLAGTPFAVTTPTPAFAAAEARTATLALQSTRPAATAPTPGDRGPPWPWFAAFLLAATLLWWLERRPR